MVGPNREANSVVESAFQLLRKPGWGRTNRGSNCTLGQRYFSSGTLGNSWSNSGRSNPALGPPQEIRRRLAGVGQSTDLASVSGELGQFCWRSWTAAAATVDKWMAFCNWLPPIRSSVLGGEDVSGRAVPANNWGDHSVSNALTSTGSICLRSSSSIAKIASNSLSRNAGSNRSESGST